MDTDIRFTDGRLPVSTIRPIVSEANRWQRWLDVEAALAQAEAKAGIVPVAAAKAISRKADIRKLDLPRIRRDMAKTSHSLMSIINELSKAVGEPHGGWVHWGATTQNIMHTGDALVLREVHNEILHMLSETFTAMAALADRGKDMVCAGRTHGQHAVPITFGFKVAVWIDEFERHSERLHQVEPRVFTAMMGGAVGNYASLGEKGPFVQAEVARLLGLNPMDVPSRSIADALAEYTCILGLIASTSGRIAKEVYNLMQTEFGEAFETVPEGTIGSSTMPHKRNPQLADDCIAIAAQIRSLVSLGLEGMLHEQEVNGANYYMSQDSILRACILTDDLLRRINAILAGLQLDPVRMRANLNLTGGLISSETVMLALGTALGRQQAHEIIYENAQKAGATGYSFEELLCADDRVTKHLSKEQVKALLDPSTKAGLSSKLAEDAAKRARKHARKLILGTVHAALTPAGQTAK
jgi:3-carboxy-cis,cis-muconate cycloisomerase